MARRDEAHGSRAEVWDDQACDYDVSRQGDAVYRSCIVRSAEQIPKGSGLCLDAGSGTGLSTEALRSRCGQVIAVDYSLQSLRVLQKKGLENVFLVQADIEALPFRPSAFDACLCANTLQHLKPGSPQQHAVAELNRVVRDGGRLVVSVHHYSRDKRRSGWVKEGKPGQPGIDYIFRFTRDDLRRLMPGSAIHAVGFYGLLRIPWLGWRMQHPVASVFGRIAGWLGFGHMLIATQSKPDTR